jgi:hypothetical protein
MDKIELTVLVNKVNTAKVKEVGTAHGGTFEDRTTAHALAETEELVVPLAEKVIDHDILYFTFDATKDATGCRLRCHRRRARHLQGDDDREAQW